MNPYEMVVVIVFLGVVAGVMNNWIKARGQAGENGLGESERRRMDDLEERIRVLEKIVTDRRYDLKEEIRRL